MVARSINLSHLSQGEDSMRRKLDGTKAPPAILGLVACQEKSLLSSSEPNLLSGLEAAAVGSWKGLLGCA